MGGTQSPGCRFALPFHSTIVNGASVVLFLHLLCRWLGQLIILLIHIQQGVQLLQTGRLGSQLLLLSKGLFHFHLGIFKLHPGIVQCGDTILQMALKAVQGIVYALDITAVLAYGTSWANVIGCTFRNNGIGFHFDSDGEYANHSMYNDNLFEGNKIAVQLDSVPTDVALNFQGSAFRDNGQDIVNSCDQPLDTSQAIFE